MAENPLRIIKDYLVQLLTNYVPFMQNICKWGNFDKKELLIIYIMIMQNIISKVNIKLKIKVMNVKTKLTAFSTGN